ncbi:MAG: hypothetical protein IPM47_17255 [Sphingobacteriales bacterium]|nr:MAG: hypothetical protein IPM47_17255 [Sphingobacteriales bacterium]
MSHLLRYLSVSFSIPSIFRNQIPAFRGAVAEKVGYEHDLFHNHDKNNGFHYRYPLIQYKLFRDHQPGMLCLQEGVDNIYHLFEKKSWEISFHNEPVSLKIGHLKMEQYTLNVQNQMRPFKLNGWQALNQNNYHEYKAIDSMAKRIVFLENILAAQLLWFAKGVGWILDQRFEVSITNLSEPRSLQFKKVPISVFDVNFKTNMFIPPQIGIGKGASKGLGIIYPNNPKLTIHTKDSDTQYKI